MTLKEILKSLAEDKDMKLKEAIVRAGLNYDNILHKFRRNTLYYTDVEKILDVLNKKLLIVDKSKEDYKKDK